MKQIKRLGWLPDHPDIRDRDFAYRVPQRLQVPPRALSSVSAPVRDQGEQGSCVGHGCYRIMANANLKAGKPFTDLSPADPYWRARQLEGTESSDSGCMIRDAVKAMASYGIAEESSWPYNQGVYDSPPPAGAEANEQHNMVEAYRRIGLVDRLDAIKDIIANQDGCVIAGFTLYDNFYAASTDGIVDLPVGPCIGGHCMVIEGYDNAMQSSTWDTAGGVLIANSWGIAWGCARPGGDSTRGYCWLPYSYVTNENLADDFWFVELVGDIAA